VKTVLKVLFCLFLFLSGLLVGANTSTTKTTATTARPSSTQGATAPLVAEAVTMERTVSESPKHPTARESGEHVTTVAKWSVSKLPIILTIATDLDTVREAAASLNVAEMVRGCRTLKRTVGKLRNELPAPDSELNAALSAMVSEFTQAADHCIRGGSALNPDVLEEATDHLNAGNEHIDLANKRITELRRHLR
jgi:hypothetical protein